MFKVSADDPTVTRKVTDKVSLHVEYLNVIEIPASFKYLESTLPENGDLDAETTQNTVMMEVAACIVCDRRISLRVKGKVPKKTNNEVGCRYMGSEKAQEKKLDAVEPSMSTWMSGVTKLDRIRNGIIRGTTTKVGET